MLSEEQEVPCEFKATFLENEKAPPTIVADLNSKTIKVGFAGELSHTWEMSS